MAPTRRPPRCAALSTPARGSWRCSTTPSRAPSAGRRRPRRGAAPTSARGPTRSDAPARRSKTRARGGRRVRGVPLRARASRRRRRRGRERERERERVRPGVRPTPGGGAGTALRTARTPTRRASAPPRGVSFSRGAGDVPAARASAVHVRAHSGARRPRRCPRRRTRPGRSDRDDRASPPNAIVPGLTGASLNDMRGKVRARRERAGQVVPRAWMSRPGRWAPSPRSAANAGHPASARARERGAEEARRMEAFEAGGRLMKKAGGRPGPPPFGEEGAATGQGPGVGVGPGELQGRAHAEQARRRVQAGQAGGDERRVPRERDSAARTGAGAGGGRGKGGGKGEASGREEKTRRQGREAAVRNGRR